MHSYLRTTLAVLCLAAAADGSANAQCYLFSSSSTGASLKVDITSILGTIGPINVTNTRSTNYTFLAINTLTVGGTTQVSSGFGSGFGGSVGISYTGSPLNATTMVFLLADPAGKADWTVTLQGSGDLLPIGLVQTLPTISNWVLPGIGTQHDAIAIGSVKTAIRYPIDSITSCAASGPTVTLSKTDLEFLFTAGGLPPVPQVVVVTKSGTGAFTWSATADVPWIILTETSGAPGLVVEDVQHASAASPPPSTSAPGILTVAINPAGLSVAPHVGAITITAAGAANSRVVIPVTVTVNPPAITGPTRTISHIANGDGWRTTAILINTGAQVESFELKFWDNSGNPLVVDLGADGVTADLIGAISPGVARFIRTVGAGALVGGWAELTSPLDIDGNSIFGLQSPGHGDSEAAVPLSPSGGTQLYIPFDYSTGHSTGIAFADPGQQLANVTATILDDSGASIAAASTITVPARGHFADVLASPFHGVIGKRGVAHFTSSANIFGLGIRANGKAFTSIDALSGLTTATKTIPHIANGGGWKTTFLIVNTSAQAAQYTLRFWDENGNALTLPLGSDGTVPSVAGTLQAGGIRIIETTNIGSLVTGWAELTGLTGAIGGTAIFALQSPHQSDSEAAVPFSTAASTHLFMPYDYSPGYSTAIALTNNGQSQATVTATFTDDDGNVLGSGQIIVPAHGHKSAVLLDVLHAIAGTRGSVSLTSNAPVFGLGIRANGVAFTSLKVIAK